MKQRDKERDNIHFNEFKNSQYDHDDKKEKRLLHMYAIKVFIKNKIRATINQLPFQKDINTVTLYWFLTCL